MEEYMQKALTQEMLQEASKRFDFDIRTIQYVGGFENFVYEFTKDDASFILRFVHSGHRTIDMVLAEIEFVDYLAQHNASVSTVVHSMNNNIVEQIYINDTDYFSVSVFTKAPGTFVKPEDKTAELFYMLGKDIGRLHRLTKDFKPVHKRFHWYEENFMDMAQRVLPEEDQFIIQHYQDITTKIRALPTNKDNYGLIHTDLHFGNIYYDQEKLTFFDFDDSAYKHFLSDIAIVIYYDQLRYNPSKEEYNDRAHFILTNVMKGYETENKIDKEFFYNLNEFLYLRSVILYIVLVAAGVHTTSNPARQQFMDLQRRRVVDHLMELDLEYVLRDI